jgi:hypothetical protein
MTLSGSVESMLLRFSMLDERGDYAKDIIKAIAEGGADVSLPVAERLGRWASIRQGESNSSLAGQLIDSGMLGRSLVGLRMLGVTGSKESVDTLLRFLDKGDLRRTSSVRGAGGDVRLDAGMKVEKVGAAEARAAMVRLAAMEGLALSGDASALPALRRVTAEYVRAGRLVNVPTGQDIEAYSITTATRLYQTSLIASLCCGDESVGGALCGQLVGNAYVASRVRSGKNAPPDVQKSVEGSLSYVLALGATSNELLRRCPVERLRPLAVAMAECQEIRVFPAACAAFGGRELPDDIRAALRSAKLPAIATLAECRKVGSPIGR